MKKLLSLLSVLTISGTSVPTTIAASSYQKEEKNNQTNNLRERMELDSNKEKRQTKPNKPSISTSRSREVLMGAIPRIEINTTINNYNRWIVIRNNYFASIQNVVRILAQNNIIVSVNNFNDNRNYYAINSDNTNNEYFILPFLINGRNFDVVIRTTDFYVQGFITYGNNNDDSTRIYRRFPINNSDCNNPDVTIIYLENLIPNNLNSNYSVIDNVRSSNYNHLVGDNNPRITWDEILHSFNRVASLNDVENSNERNTPMGIDFARIILATSESIRFTEVGAMLQRTNVYSENNPNYIPQVDSAIYYWSNFSDIINNWGSLSANILNINRNQRMVFLIFSIAATRLLNQCNNRPTRDTNSFQNVCYTYSPIILYYDKKDNKNKTIYHESTLHNYKNYLIHTFDLGKVNPLNYNKIVFLGDIDDKCWGVSTHWGSWIFDNKQEGCYSEKIKKYEEKNINQYLKKEFNNNLRDFIKNKKITDNSSWSEIKDNASMWLQSFNIYDFAANIQSEQKVGITFYWEDNNYYLQVIAYQYLEWWASEADLKGWIKLGNGIKLYNE